MPKIHGFQEVSNLNGSTIDTRSWRSGIKGQDSCSKFGTVDTVDLILWYWCVLSRRMTPQVPHFSAGSSKHEQTLERIAFA